MPEKRAGKWCWGNLCEKNKGDLVKKVYGIWIGQGKPGTWHNFWYGKHKSNEGEQQMSSTITETDANIGIILNICESIALAAGSNRFSQTMNEALIGLMEIELYTSLFYTEMATWGSKKGLRGLEKWGNEEAKQEFGHYQDLVGFAQMLMGDTKFNKDVKVAPFADTSQISDLFAALHDLMVKKTEIYKMAVVTAMKTEDPVSENFLYDPYVDQIGATKRSLEMMNKTQNMTGDSLIIFDAHLAQGGLIPVEKVMPAAD